MDGTIGMGGLGLSENEMDEAKVQLADKLFSRLACTVKFSKVHNTHTNT
jgi:hypothetical protein